MTMASRRSAEQMEKSADELEVRSLLATIATHFKGALVNDPYYQQYRTCERKGTASSTCLELKSKAFYSALSTALQVPIARGEWPFKELAHRIGENVFHGIVDRICVESADDAERVAALKILSEIPNGPWAALSSEAYAGLAQRTEAEIELLLIAHRHVPLPEMAASEVSSLALNTSISDGIRSAAVAALAHPKYADRLTALVAELLSSASISLPIVQNSLPFALGRCGPSCSSAVQRLATSTRPEYRMLAVEALTSMAPADARSERARLELLFSNEAATEEELAKRRDHFDRVSSQ